MQHYEYVEYIDCKCNPDGSENNICNKKTGDCTCQNKFICGQNCDQCCDGYYAHPNCQCEYFNNRIYSIEWWKSWYCYFSACSCDQKGSTSTSCDKNGNCKCKSHIVGPKCSKCEPGYFGYPNCQGNTNSFDKEFL